MLAVGSKAPEVTGTLDDGLAFVLSEAARTKNVVLYFYPRDFTPAARRKRATFATSTKQSPSAGR